MSREVMYMPRGRPAKCPYCGGSSINNGFRKTKTMGKRRIKLCKDCRRKFTPKNQKLVQPTEKTPIEDGNDPEDVAEPNETNQPDQALTEPTSDSKPLLNMLDQEWTS